MVKDFCPTETVGERRCYYYSAVLNNHMTVVWSDTNVGHLLYLLIVLHTKQQDELDVNVRLWVWEDGDLTFVVWKDAIGVGVLVQIDLNRVSVLARL